MRTLKATIVAALVVLGLVGFLATNAIAAVAHTFCTVSVAVFAATSFFGLAAKLRA